MLLVLVLIEMIIAATIIANIAVQLIVGSQLRLTTGRKANCLQSNAEASSALVLQYIYARSLSLTRQAKKISERQTRKLKHHINKRPDNVKRYIIMQTQLLHT